MADFKYNKVKLNNHFLFLYIYDKSKIKKYADIENNLINTTLIANHKMIEMVGEIKVPKNIISLIKNSAKKAIKKVILNLSDKSSSRIIDKTSNFLEYKIADVSTLLHLYEIGGEPPDIFDVKNHLIFM